MKHYQFVFLLSFVTLLNPIGWVRAETEKFIQAASKVPGKYVVVLDESADSGTLDVTAREATTFLNASIQETYTHIFQGFSAYLDEREAISLSHDPRVKFVAEDSLFSIPAHETARRGKRRREKNATWGLDRLDQTFLPLNRQYQPIGRGENVTVYVVDTGIRVTHEEFEGRAVFGVNTTSLPWEECNSHGTHVAGTIGGKNYGVAKKVTLTAVKVLGEKDELGECVETGSLSQVIAGLEWIGQNARRPAVVNMSLGASGSSLPLELAVRNLISQGITVVVAAGNARSRAEFTTPARVREAITVAASNSNDEISLIARSNWGAGIDVFAPGDEIESAGIRSDTDVEARWGTSMAAPHVTGFVALLLQKNPSLTPARIENIVKDHATKGLVRGLENYPGTPNRLLSIRHVPDLTDFARLDPYFYLAMNPDVSAAVGGVENYAGGAAHWATQGVHQGRMSSPAHWPGYYFYLYQDLANFFGHNSWSAAHNHWYHSGRAEGRSGSPAFDPFFYFSLYPELEGAFGRNNFRLATDHWIQNGIDEGRVGSVAFDPFFYLSAHGDVRAVVGEGNYRKALLHWFQYGINEGRRASWFFDPVAYFRHNPDLAGVFGATNYRMGLFHYIKHGRFEGRRAVP